MTDTLIIKERPQAIFFPLLSFDLFRLKSDIVDRSLLFWYLSLEYGASISNLTSHLIITENPIQNMQGIMRKMNKAQMYKLFDYTYKAPICNICLGLLGFRIPHFYLIAVGHFILVYE